MSKLAKVATRRLLWSALKLGEYDGYHYRKRERDGSDSIVIALHSQDKLWRAREFGPKEWQGFRVQYQSTEPATAY